MFIRTSKLKIITCICLIVAMLASSILPFMGDIMFFNSNKNISYAEGTSTPTVGNVANIATGFSHSLALIKAGGTVWAWGNNAEGQLGNGTKNNTSTPTQVSGLTDVISVAAGQFHSVALKSDGTVWTWGNNQYGQLGNGTAGNIPILIPVQVITQGDTLTGVIAISAGSNHTLALKADGTVWSWGHNSVGQLGNLTTTDSNFAVQVKKSDGSLLGGITDISAGENNVLALGSDKTVWAWGDNTYGQLGKGITGNKNHAIQVDGLSNIIATATGSGSCAAVRSDGTVWTWGLNFFGSLGLGGDPIYDQNPYPIPRQVRLDNVKDISIGIAACMMALKNDGTVWVWGINSDGQLGDETTNNRSTPAQISALSDIKEVSAGFYHVLALKDDGTIYSWGGNTSGQLGLCDTTTRPVPIKITSLKLFSKIMLTAELQNNNDYVVGTGNTVSLKVKDDNGTVQTSFDGAKDVTISGVQVASDKISYGSFKETQLTGSSQTVSVPFTNGVANNIELVLYKARQDIMFSIDGAYSANVSITALALPPTNIKVLSDIISPDIDGGTFTRRPTIKVTDTYGNVCKGVTVTASSDGNWTMIGNNSAITDDNGIATFTGLGVASLAKAAGSEIRFSVKGTQLASSIIKSYSEYIMQEQKKLASNISAGPLHSLAINKDGTVLACGDNRVGQLGTGNTTRSNIPVPVNDINNVVSVLAASSYSMALKNDGTVWTWGINSSGELGNKTTGINSSSPVQVVTQDGGPLKEIIDISAYQYYALALKADGTVWAWGNNSAGQLGNLTNTNSNFAVQVQKGDGSLFDGIIDISAGQYYALALKNDGTVWAWGNNDKGQLGDGTTSNKNYAIQVNGLSDAIKVAAGGYSCAAIIEQEGEMAGILRTWGDNSSGQLGIGTTDINRHPISTRVGAGVKDVSVSSGNYVIALKNDGTIWAWGANSSGQLGDGTKTGRSTPAQISDSEVTGFSNSNIKEISASTSHVLALKDNGTVWAWGSGGYGKLGLNDTYDRPFPTQVTSLTLLPKAMLTAELQYNNGYVVGVENTVSLAMKDESGNVDTSFSGPKGITISGVQAASDGVSYGSFNGTTLAGPSKTVSVTFTNGVASNIPLVLYEEGTQYLVFSTAGAYSANIIVSLLEIPPAVPTYITVQQSITTPIINGGAFEKQSVVLVKDQYGNPCIGVEVSVSKDGSNSGNWTLKGTTTVITNENGIATFIDLGARNNTFNDLTATVKFTAGTLTATDNVNLPLNANTTIAAGGSSTIALATDGTVWTWGSNSDGQLGIGSVDGNLHSTPIQVVGLPSGVNVSAVAAGSYHMVALMTDGTVYTWGDNQYGQLGDGSNTDRSTPVKVSGLTNIIAIAAGQYYTLALKSDGTIQAWGYNNKGQLGNNSMIDSKTPVQVSGLTDVKAIAAGGEHSVALKSDGTVWAWGDNNKGQLGDNSMIDSKTPVQVSELTDITAIAAGQYHTLALKSDGTVRAWGANSSGQLGINSIDTTAYATQISSISNVKSIAAGGLNSGAIDISGNVYFWGDNTKGQIGNNSTINSLIPTLISGLTNIVATASGRDHSVALEEGGRIWTFGWNDKGQLGNDSTVNSYTPVIAQLTSIPSYGATASVSKTNPASGELINVTLIVKDLLGNTDTNFNGTYDVIISGVQAAPNGSYGSFNETPLKGSTQTIHVTFVYGVAEVGLVLNSSEKQTIGFSIADLKVPNTNKIDITVTGVSVQIQNAPEYKNNTSEFTVKIQFNRDVTGFTQDDVIVTNATVTSFSGLGSVYTVGITPNGNGNITIDIAQGVAVDSFDNQSAAASQVTVIYDSIAPTVEITGPTELITEKITVTITFNKEVTGFNIGDIAVVNGITSNFCITSSKVYTVDITPMANGTLRVAIPKNAARDATGNGNILVQYSVLAEAPAMDVANTKKDLIYAFNLSLDQEGKYTWPSSVSGNIILPTRSVELETTITWSSSNPNVIANNGKVTRQETDVTVTMTATITKGSISDTISFDVTVLAAQSSTLKDQEAVASTKNQLTLSTLAASDIILLTDNTCGTIITWSSSNDAITNDGNIIRPR